MAESRFEEPLLCLDIEFVELAARIKGCGSTCDDTEARDGIQTWGSLAAVMRCGAWWWERSKREERRLSTSRCRV